MSGTHLVENVETTLRLELEGDSRFLQKVRVNVTRGKHAMQVEVNSNEFTETGGVIVTNCFCIT